jgi:hypothetical protein
MSDSSKEEFKQWCVLELMGHRRLGGLVTEALIAGSPFIRIDIHIQGLRVPDGSGEPEDVVTTQFYSPASVYSIIPVGEQEARAVARYNQAEPIHRFEIPELNAARTGAYGSIDDGREVPDVP